MSPLSRRSPSLSWLAVLLLLMTGAAGGWLGHHTIQRHAWMQEMNQQLRECQDALVLAMAPPAAPEACFVSDWPSQPPDWWDPPPECPRCPRCPDLSCPAPEPSRADGQPNILIGWDEDFSEVICWYDAPGGAVEAARLDLRGQLEFIDD